MREQEEINQAIERLRENKQKSKRINAFGEDCHGNIDAMIDVLENKMTQDQVDNKYYDSPFYDATNSILGFLNEGEDIEDHLYPEYI